MNVLFVTSELSGYAKTGGLADVSAALPKALRGRGVDVRILVPFYGSGRNLPPCIAPQGHLEGLGEIPSCNLAAGTIAGIPVIFINCRPLYDRAGTPYASPDRVDWPDNDVRFARLALAAAQIAQGEGGIGWRPDLIHANDWPTALAPGYLVWRGAAVPSIFTVHNLAYQGLFDASRLRALGIPDSAYSIHGVEFHHRLSFAKAGLIYATHVTTVSPTYAREITTEPFGCGLHGLLATLSVTGRLTGIMNRIGEEWAPEHDPHLVRNYPPGTQEAKERNANALRRDVGLKKHRGPLFAMVSRLVHQKGIDLALTAAEMIVERGGQFVLLGEGERNIEAAALDLAAHMPDFVGVKIAFDEILAHRAIAGSDFYLMPSRFEPCGLNQMYAQRYGSLPIAHATGGLVDSIADDKTGFLFSDASGDALKGAIVRALQVFAEPRKRALMRRTAMAQDFTWASAAEEYENIYRRIVHGSG